MLENKDKNMWHKRKFIPPVINVRQGAPESLLTSSELDTSVINKNDQLSDPEDARQAKRSARSMLGLDNSGTGDTFGRGSF